MVSLWSRLRPTSAAGPPVSPQLAVEPAGAEAAMLAETAPAALLEARRLAANAAGAHGRRRAGQGETFWQFRDHRPEDGAKAVDWRRSGRGERLYVRERELEAAQTAWFWLDPEPGFDWSSAPKAWPTKRRRALVLCLALAIALARGGERVGALGLGPGVGGPLAAERLGHLLARSPAASASPSPRSVVVFASDFYAPLEVWRSRLRAVAERGAHGALLMVSDPAEEDFPFRGRTLFERPGGGETVTLGKPEAAREAFAERLARHRAGLRELAHAAQSFVLSHRTDRAPAPALAALIAGVEDRR